MKSLFLGGLMLLMCPLFSQSRSISSIDLDSLLSAQLSVKSVGFLDQHVKEVYQQLQLNDTMDIQHFGRMLNLRELIECAEIDMKMVYKRAIQEVDWNAVMEGMDWNKMMKATCDSANRDSMLLSQQAPQDSLKSPSLDIMKCVKMPGMMEMMKIMDPACMEEMMRMSPSQMMEKPQSGDMKSFCRLAQCLDLNLLFKDTDWNCLFSNMDLDAVVDHIDWDTFMEGLNDLNLGDSDSAILKKQSLHPFFEFLDPEVLQEQMQMNVDIYDMIDVEKIQDCMYQVIFKEKFTSLDELDNLSELMDFSYSLMQSTFGESRELKYFIAIHRLFFQLVENSANLDLEQGLAHQLLLKDLLIIAERERFIDRLKAQEVSARYSLGDHFELESLGIVFDNLSRIYTRMGKYSQALSMLEVASHIREHLVNQYDAEDNWDDFLLASHSQSKRDSLESSLARLYSDQYPLSNRNIEDTTSLIKSLLNGSQYPLLQHKHPEFIQELLTKGKYELVLDFYLLFKDMIVETPLDTMIAPSNIPANPFVDRWHGKRLISGIYHNMVRVLDSANLAQDPRYLQYQGVPDRLDLLSQKQMLVSLWMNVGTAHFMVNNYEFSQDYFEKAWDLLKSLPNLDYLMFQMPELAFSPTSVTNKTPIYVAVGQRLANAYAAQRNYEKVEDFALEVIHTIRSKEALIEGKNEQDLQRDLFSLYQLLGQNSLMLKDSVKASSYFKKNQLVSETSPEPIFSYFSHHNFGMYFFVSGQAGEAYRHFSEAKEYAVQAKFVPGQIDALINLAYLDQRGDSIEQALRNYHEAQVLANSIHLYSALYRIHEMQGSLFFMQEAYQKALDQYQNAVWIIEDSLFSNFYQGLSSKQLVLEQSFSGYSGAVSCALELDLPEKAYHFVQQIKSRTLNDMLIAGAIKANKIPEELITQKQDILGALNTFQIRTELQKDDSIEQFSKDLQLSHKDLLRQLQIVNAKIREKVFSKSETTSVSIQELQTHLKPKQAIIEYFVGEKEVLAFVISKETFGVKSLGETGGILSQLQKVVQQIEELEDMVGNDTWQGNFQRNLHRLYEIIFHPLKKDNLLSDIEELILVPDAQLFRLPFEMLVQKDETFLFSSFTNFQYYPSSTSIHYQKQDTTISSYTRDLLVVAKSNFEEYEKLREQNPLRKVSTRLFPDTLAVSFLSEESATAINLSEMNLRAYRYMLVSTHGIIHPTVPELSYLALSDGPLSLFETFELELGNEVVVLSACHTAKGEFQRGAGMMGFTRSFLFAGAKSLVVSLWQVDDLPTEKLMELFFVYLSKGLPPAKALMEAKSELMTWQNGRYANPYYWAAFVLFGEVEDRIAN